MKYEHYLLENGKYEIVRDSGTGLQVATYRNGEVWNAAHSQLQFMKVWHAALNELRLAGKVHLSDSLMPLSAKSNEAHPPGTLRYRSNESREWVVVSPRQPMYSMATLLAEEYWDVERAGWKPITDFSGDLNDQST